MIPESQLLKEVVTQLVGSFGDLCDGRGPAGDSDGGDGQDRS
ncbi:hypothetical protein [Haloglycomyces albus]|nr:hypothetical protein [Haloglycomyces albus]